MIKILDGLARSAFAEIVKARDHDEAAAGGIEHKSNVGEVGVGNVLNFGEGAGLPDADHGAAGVSFAIERFDCIQRLRLGERDVDRGENSACDGKEMRGENELRSR